MASLFPSLVYVMQKDTAGNSMLGCLGSPEVPGSVSSFPHLLDLRLLYVVGPGVLAVFSRRTMENMSTPSSQKCKALCNFEALAYLNTCYIFRNRLREPK